MNPPCDSSENLKILVVSVSELWTTSVMSVLATIPEVELLEIARGTLTAYQLVRDRQPHMLIMDDSLPLQEGLLMVTRMKQEGIPVYCIVMVPTTRQMKMAETAGVDDVVVRSGSSNQLETAVQTGRKHILGVARG